MQSRNLFVLTSALLVLSACGGGGSAGGRPCGPGIACPDGQECVANLCVVPGGGGEADTEASDGESGGDGCTPLCGERQCGPDDCGGSCGTCGADMTCDASGLCIPGGCQADCAGRQCGSDGCGGSCGDCNRGSTCNQAGRCEAGPCTADCAGRECGDDGCGGSCGDCASGESCSDMGRCAEGPCEPRCAGRDCGPDGCGGLCGSCGAGETCSAFACVPGQCGEGAPAIEGALLTDVTDVGFDAVSVSVTHKQDIDEYEDGCITAIVLEFTNGVGCRLSLWAGGAWDVNGGLVINRMTFSADSQCRNFSDDREGDFDISQDVIGSIVPAVRTVPDENATRSCFPTTLRVRLEPRTLEGQDVSGDPRSLEVEGSTLRVTGEVVSQGDTRARCPCEPACTGRECGDDGCVGVCGTCLGNARCEAGLCVCQPSCAGRQCGDDGCGGSCGGCSADLTCVEGTCVCVPDCAGRECGSDGCGGTCGSCGAGESCSDGGRCRCTPQCGARECGSDGCGGTCGTCPAGEPCSANGVCGCDPQCTGRSCGDDGCGGTCGTCDWGWTCESDGRCGCGAIDQLGCCEGNVAFWCAQGDPFGGGGETINYRECADGCGWVNSQTGYYCGATGSDPGGRPRDCGLGTCEASCAGRECGNDGCGGSCGTCLGTERCDAGECVPCQPDCSGRECGDNGCGGTCGTCGAGEDCTTAGRCASEPPLEEFGKMCQSDDECFEGLTCEPALLGITVCTMICTPLVGECPHNLFCFPDLSGSGVGYCSANPAG